VISVLPFVQIQFRSIAFVKQQSPALNKYKYKKKILAWLQQKDKISSIAHAGSQFLVQVAALLFAWLGKFGTLLAG